MRLLAAVPVVLATIASVLAGQPGVLADDPPARTPARMTVQLSCLELTRHLRTFIGIRTDLDMQFSEDTCLTSSMVQMFLRETSALLPIQTAPPSSVNVTLTDHDQHLAQILALALVGRHYTHKFQLGQVFFEYDPASQILTPHMPRCEYQRSFLVLLLFVSIVLLIFALVMQSLLALEKSAVEHSAVEQQLAVSSAAPSAPPRTGVRSNLLHGISIDFAHQRRPAAAGYALL